MKNIISFEAACKKLKKDPNALPDVSELDESMGKFVITIFKLAMIRDAIVGKWKADYADGDQYKWYPWFRYDRSASAFRFFAACYVCAYASAGSGARLSFETEEQAIYFGTTFIKEFNVILLK